MISDKVSLITRELLFIELIFSSVICSEIAVVAYEPNEAIKEEKFKTLNSVTIPFYLKKLEEMAKENNGHLALNRTTWADVWFTGVSQYLNFMAKQDLIANQSHLKKVVDNVMAIEGIKKYVAKRPQTES